MELKINVDTKTIATDMVRSMGHNLHNSIVSFVAQRFGAINPQAGYLPYPPQGPGVPPFPGQYPFGMFPGQYPPPSHPYAQFGVPPAPYQPQYRSQAFDPNSTYARAQQPGGNLNAQPPEPTEYAKLMDKLVGDEALVMRVEEILKAHIEEFVNAPPAKQY